MKKEFAKRSKKVIAEVDENVKWVYGDTTIHVSEIDYFVSTPLKSCPMKTCQEP